MTQLWMDGFDHYGVGDDGAIAMLEGVWANISGNGTAPNIPSFGARTGNAALRIANSNDSNVRRVLPGSETTIIVSAGVYLPELPTLDGKSGLIGFMVSGEANAGWLYCQSNGALAVKGDSGTQNGNLASAVLAQTSGPVLTAGTWHHIEVKFTQSETIGGFEIFVDQTQVLDTFVLDTGANQITSVTFGQPIATAQAPNLTPDFQYWDDIIVRDTVGTVNNDFEGDARVATLQPIANGVEQGWAVRSVEKLGAGVLTLIDPTDRNSALMYADNAVLEIGSGSFTYEAFVRWNTIPVLSEQNILASKDRQSTNEVSWRLALLGPDLGATLNFVASNDGSTETIVHAWPFIPATNTWYHIAISRDGTDSYLFINGIQVGSTKTDSLTYDDNTAQLVIGSRQSGASTVVADEGVNGWMDGVRFTVGAALYNADFTPPSAPLTVGANTELLLNFDSQVSIVDESTNGFTASVVGDAAVLFPDDSEAFQCIDGTTPDDTDFIEAALVAAQGLLTFTGLPSDGDTITLGASVYTFVTPFVDAAQNVFVGADVDAAMNNLVAAITLGSGVGSLYGTGTTVNLSATAADIALDDMVLATAFTPGAVGNSIDSLSTAANATWGALTLEGGADIPGESEFDLSSLTGDATGVLSLAVVGRLFKTDAGSSEVTMSFVESGGASEQGTPKAVTVSESYYEDTFELDPSTSNPLTPSSLVGSRIRIDRTT